MPDSNGARITTAEIFAELRAIGGRVDGVRQTLDETVKPKIVRLEEEVAALERSVDALNVKFYGILIGGIGGGLALFGKLSGWY